MIVVTADVFLAALVPHAQHHRASSVWLRESDAAHAILAEPPCVGAELAGSLARELGDSGLAADAVDWFSGLEGLELHPVDPRRAAALAAELQLPGLLAWYVELADRLRAPLVTWNRDLTASGAAEVVEVLTPDDWPEWL